VPKGIKTVLKERGCFPTKKLNAKCKVRCPDPIIYPVLALDKPLCCLARILLNHHDFYY
jgi:hypothetical protein